MTTTALALTLPLMPSPASAQPIAASGDVTPTYPGGNPWNLGGVNLTVGNTSNGSLTIQSGGAVTNAPIVFLGNASGATGQVTISNGSLTSQFLEVGVVNGAQGIVTVTNGTIDTTANAAAAGRLGQGGGSGTVTLNNNSVWNSVGSIGVGQNQGGSGILNVLTGSTVNITGVTGSGLFIGNVGSSTAGTVLIDGAGSAVNSAADVYVGAQDGSGAVIIRNGGLLHADGMIDVGGAAFSTSTANGSVTVTGAGSTMTAGTDINVGMMRGTLNVLNGATVNAGGLFSVGGLATGVGDATISGPGSSVTAAHVIVGVAGAGSLVIDNGGVLTTTNPAPAAGDIADQAGSTGTVTVTGAGSAWNSAGSIGIGQQGTGTLNILNGGAVTAPAGTPNSPTAIGNASSGAVGAVMVDGAGSSFAVGGDFIDGNLGRGSLTVSNGGAVTAGQNSYIGFAAGGVGAATVTGAGSTWTTSAALGVGVSGQGALTIANDGQVTAASTTIAQNGGSTGTLNIGAAAGSPAAAPGMLNTPSVVFGGGAGQIVFNHTSSSYTFAPAISGAGAVDVYSGATALTAANTYSGGTTIHAGALQLGNGGASGSITGDVTDNGVLAFDRSDTTTFAGVIAGSGAVTQIGAGTTILTAANSYGGGTTISAGTLQLGDGTANGSITGNVADNGALAFNRSDTATFAGVISGAGAVTQIGAGTTILTAASTYSGGTTISAGTLQLGDGTTNGSITGPVTDNGLLAFAPAAGTAITNPGVISGVGALSQIGAGTTVLTGANTYSGGTTISAGVLQLGDGTTNGSIAGNVADNGVLAFAPAAGTTLTHSGIVSGAGAVTQIGAGTTILTAASTYGGGTTISAGTLQLGAGGASGSITGDVTDNGALAFDRSDTATFAGVISGAGAVSQIGAGTTVLTAANTYSGGTTISAGTLQLGDGTTNGSIAGDVADNGVLAFNPAAGTTITHPGVVSGAGSLSQIGAGTTVLTGADTYSGGTTISAGTLQLGAGGASGGITGDVTDNGVLAFDRSDTATFAGVISGSGAVTQIGDGTTILSANNTYTGGTTISAGTLQLGAGGASGGITGDVTDNGVLAFDRSDTATFSGVISGAGAVRQIGAGTTILTADNSYAGPTTVAAGTLAVGDAAHPGAALSGGGAVTVASGATLGGFGSVGGSVTNNGTLAVGNALAAFASGPNAAFTIGGNLTNAGVVTLSGASPGNTLVVNGLYSGQNGVLKVSTYLNAGGALSNQITDRLLVKGDPIGSTTVVVKGSGPGALTGIPNASNGISIIQVAGASTANAFTLPGGYVSAGGSPYQYHLNAYGPGSPNGSAYGPQSLVGNPSGFWDYRLQTAYVTPSGPVDPAPAPPPSAPNTDPPPPPTPPDSRPAVAPQVPVYISAPTALFNVGFQDIDSLHRRLGEIADAQGQGEPQRGEVFVRAYGGAFNYTSTRSFGNYGYNAAQDYAAVEFGGSKVVIDNQAGTLRAGLAGIIDRLWLTPSAVDGRSEASFNSEKLAGIVTYQATRGWYLDGIVYGGMFDGAVTTDARGQAAGLNGTSVGVSLEGGWPLRLNWRNLVAEPEAEIVFQHQDFANRTDVDGIRVNMGGLDQGVVRVGGRLLRQFQTSSGALVTPYLKANLLQGFADGGTIDLSGVGFETGQYGTAIQMGGGVTGTLTSRLAIHADVAYQHQIDNGGFRGWAVDIGLRYDF